MLSLAVLTCADAIRLYGRLYMPVGPREKKHTIMLHYDLFLGDQIAKFKA